MKRLCHFALVLGFAVAAAASPLKSDETLVFFPSMAVRGANVQEWSVEVRGQVYELETRRLLLPAFRKALGFDSDEMTGGERAIFEQRARAFLADNQRGKEITIQLGGRTVKMERSAANGQFQGRFKVPAEEMNSMRKAFPAGVPFQAMLPAGDSRPIGGAIFPLDSTGWSVISDIDDTIKVSVVTNRQELLKNTFLRPFTPVPGMADVYKGWAQRSGAQFHYVSASPWQLYPAMGEFIQASGFPGGSFHMKTFRWKDQSFFALFGSPEKYKPGVIEPLLKQFPQRRYVLVGDSGEKDPEIYGALARKLPEQIKFIYIRDVTAEPAGSLRYQAAFRDVPASVWRVFKQAEELSGVLLVP